MSGNFLTRSIKLFSFYFDTTEIIAGIAPRESTASEANSAAIEFMNALDVSTKKSFWEKLDQDVISRIKLNI